MKIIILGPVQHDARLYQAGEIADIPSHQAAALIHAGSAEEADKAALKAKAEADAKAQAEEDARLAAEALAKDEGAARAEDEARSTAQG